MNYEQLYKDCLEYYPNYKKTLTNAMVAYSGEKTGRSPKDKRIVRDETTENINWGDVNIPMSDKVYMHYKEIAIDYIDKKPYYRTYIVTGYAGWLNKRKIKVVCVNPYHAIFMKNMLVEIYDDNRPADFTIYCVGELKLSDVTPYPLQDICNSAFPLKDTLIGFNFKDKSMIIFGTEYAGEMKKAVFSYMLYEMPKIGLLPLHSSANIDKNGNTTLFLGLSGTGKTTLSTDGNSKLIGDDEHIWTDDQCYNIEGGCYAKCIGLNKNSEPEIYNAIKFGSILENTIIKENGEIDFDDNSITENTRCSYPIYFIENSVIPCVGEHPKNIIFLTCDATGILPIVSELKGEQIEMMFVCGYTSKVAGTEIGVTKPVSTFSACFAGPFIVWHPRLYSKMLMEKINKHGSRVWLVNTGYNVAGKRYPIETSRKVVDLIKTGEIDTLVKKKLDYFDIDYFVRNEGDELFDPMLLWKSGYDAELKILYQKFMIIYNK